MKSKARSKSNEIFFDNQNNRVERGVGDERDMMCLPAIKIAKHISYPTRLDWTGKMWG
jgi:hypothetical protein